MDNTPGLANIDDTRPLPGIDWEITVDRATAGRFGADVATVAPLVQLVTRGALLGTYRPKTAMTSWKSGCGSQKTNACCPHWTP